MKPKLKVGLLLNGNKIPAWIYYVINEIINSDYAEIALIVEDTTVSTVEKSFTQKIKKGVQNKNLIAYRLFQKVENKMFRPEYDAFAIRNADDLLAGVPRLAVMPHRTKFSDKFNDEDINKIASYDIDVFLRFGFRILKGKILNIAKYGIWSYHHGDNKVNRGGPPGVWEVLEGWDETGVILQILSENLDAGTVLCRSTSYTEKFSVKKNKNTVYWKASRFVPRKLRELYEIGGKNFLQKVKEENEHPDFYSNKLHKAPGNTTLAKHVIKLYYNWFKDKLFRLFYNKQWILLYNIDKKGRLGTSFYKFKKILPPKDRFWADPHVVYKDDKYYVFIEELIFKENIGFLSVFEMDKKGNYTYPTIILKKPYHLSYPFIIAYKDDYYMIPETKANKKIDLYKCTDFPYKWDYQMTLIDNIEAVDATVINYQSKYWMFTNVVEVKGASTNDELFLFYADDLLSQDWKPHPQNPIISDVKRSRSAGAIFEYNGKLYRPSQNSVKIGGYGMKMNVIKTLTEIEYKEEEVSAIYPQWEKNLLATHTFAFDNGLTVIDALIKRRKK